MKKLIALFLTICILSLLVPVAVTAADFEIKGDTIIFKPPVGTDAYVQYKLMDGATEVTDGIEWSINGDGVTIDQDGYVKVTNDAVNDFTVYASTGYSIEELTVTVSDKVLFYDYEDGTVGSPYVGAYGHEGQSVTRIMESSDGNKYTRGHGTVVWNTTAPNDVRLVRAFQNEPNNSAGVTEMHAIKTNVVTLEGKFFNHNQGAWGIGGRQWVFYLVFNNNDGNFLNGAQLGHGTQGQTIRVIDMHTDKNNAAYTLTNYHGAFGDYVNYDKLGTAEGGVFVHKVGSLDSTSLTGNRGWVNMRMTIDFERFVYTVWADDVIVYENYPLPTYGKTSAVSLRNWYFSCAGDDIAIYSGTKNPKKVQNLPESEPESGWTESFSEVNETTGASYEKTYDFELYRDESYKTSLISDKIDGKYAVDVEFKVENPEPYADIIFATDVEDGIAKNQFAKFMVSSRGAMTVVKTETVNADETVSITYNTIPGYKPGEENILRLVADTNTGTYDIYLNDFTKVAIEDVPFLDGNDGVFGALKCFANVGNVKVSGVNVYKIENGTIYEAGMPGFNSMPVYLIADPTNVTSNIDVSPLADYTVTSSDETVVAVDGTISWKPFDSSPATLYAAFENGEMRFKKGYDFVVAPSLSGYNIFELCYDEFKYFDAIPVVADDNLEFNTDTILDIEATWHSSDTNVIGNDGTINKGPGVGFADISLMLSKNGESETYGTVIVAVAPDGSANVGITEYETSMALSGFPLLNAFDGSYSTYFKGTKRNNRENSITLTVDETKFISRLFVAEKTPSIINYKVESSEDGITWNEVKTGSFSDIYSKVIAFEPIKTKYLKFTILDLSEEFVEITELVPISILTEQQSAEASLEELFIDPTVKVNSDIELPSTSLYGDTFAWTSSPSGIISETGVFTAPKYDTEVVLTATVSTSTESYSRTFVVTASGTNGPKGAEIVSGGGGGGGGGSSSTSGESISPTFPEQTTTPVLIPNKPKTSFVDMENHWAKDYVKELAAKGIVSEAENYAPDRCITREEFTKLLVCAAGIEINSNLDNPFKDAVSGAWYVNYILTAKEANIISGMSEDFFGIGNNISRQDAALMLIRALGFEENNDGNNDFEDDAEIASYSREAVYQAKAIGLINGYEDNTFKPAGLLTRGEAAAIICRFLDAEN